MLLVVFLLFLPGLSMRAAALHYFSPVILQSHSLHKELLRADVKTPQLTSKDLESRPGSQLWITTSLEINGMFQIRPMCLAPEENSKRAVTEQN